MDRKLNSMHERISQLFGISNARFAGKRGDFILKQNKIRFSFLLLTYSLSIFFLLLLRQKLRKKKAKV